MIKTAVVSRKDGTHVSKTVKIMELQNVNYYNNVQTVEKMERQSTKKRGRGGYASPILEKKRKKEKR